METGKCDMDQLARQMDRVREELCRLLDLYEEADPTQRRAIASRCEQLGGQVQDLVGMLKFSLLQLREEAQTTSEANPEYVRQVADVTGNGLRAIHQAGEEIGQAIRFLREAWGEPEWAGD